MGHVDGDDDGPGYGVYGFSDGGDGVCGNSSVGKGMHGRTQQGDGVLGEVDYNGQGVHGVGHGPCNGVVGESENSIGMRTAYMIYRTQATIRISFYSK